MSVFNYLDYRAYIEYQIKSHSQVKGYQGVLAENAGCQRSYLSQVLNSHVELTPDHAANLASYWQFNRDETEYFIDLVMLSRAASPKLKKILQAKLQSMQKKQQDLSERFQRPTAPASEHAPVYYSSWYWAAIHILLSVPGYSSSQKIAERLCLTQELVVTTLESLQNMGLVMKKNGEWKIVTTNMHLPQESPLTNTNHLNWRMRGLSGKVRNSQQDLHYTAVHSLSKQAIHEIKEVFLQAIDKSRQIVAPSQDEDAVAICFDLFEL